MYRQIKRQIAEGKQEGIRSSIAIGLRKGVLDQKQIQMLLQDIQDRGLEEELIAPTTCFTICSERDKWNQAYLWELANAVSCGDSSEELLLHMAEVSEYLYRYHRWGARILLGVVIAVVVLLLLLLLS